MRKSKFRKGLVVAVIVLFVGVSINPITISRPRNYNITNEDSSLDVISYQNIPPVVNRTFPTDSATNISISGIPINAEIYDSDDDDLWVEVWSNFTGNWVEYASYDVLLDWQNRTWNNESSIILVDFNEDGLWTVLDLMLLVNGEGWGQSGNWGFFCNISVTDDWGMTSYYTTYYWSVNVTDNFTWTNETYHFSTKSIGFDVVYVDDDFNESTPGWGYDHFDSIQDGVDAVNESGTVYVYNGTYYEQIRINKSINLIGEDKNSTFIDGNNVGDVTIRIFVDNVNISGFTIQESGNGYSGLCTYANNTNISNNIVKSNGNHGIIVRYWDNNIISNNIVFDNQQNGINIQDGSKNNLISNNNISENGVQGIRLLHSSNNTISGNEVKENLDDGIALNQDSKNNTVINNYIADNLDDGIQIYNSNDNLILKNEIIENIETGIQITENSNNNQLYHNNIINNTLQANDLCNNYWDNGYPSGGNYWDDYTEDDLYNGPNQDIPGSDGIGDTPYNISGGDNQDLYPLMYPFELYYILNISAPEEVKEGDTFNVVVTSIGGTVIPLAIVEFNDDLKFSDSDGRAYFIAPPVETDTYYDITATKEGYTGDTETILVKDVPVEFVSTFILGRIDNLTTGGDVITFEAVNIRVITLKFPPYSTPYTSGELITISKNPIGFLGALFGVQLIFAFCGLIDQPYTSTISMNRFSHDDFANTVIWLVSGVEGNPVETKDVEMILLNESGQLQPDAEITFNEVNVEGYINPGDTFTVVAPSDGYYVFMLTHKISGATMFKSSLTHY